MCWWWCCYGCYYYCIAYCSGVRIVRCDACIVLYYYTVMRLCDFIIVINSICLKWSTKKSIRLVYSGSMWLLITPLYLFVPLNYGVLNAYKCARVVAAYIIHRMQKIYIITCKKERITLKRYCILCICTHPHINNDKQRLWRKQLDVYF